MWLGILSLENSPISADIKDTNTAKAIKRFAMVSIFCYNLHMNRSAASRRYYLKHKEHIIARVKEYRRNHAIRYGKNSNKHSIYGITKAPYPSDSKCQYCDADFDSLQYHHWDDSNYSDGVWVCKGCHIRIRRVLKYANIMILKREALLTAIR